MNVFIIAVISADGFIAERTDQISTSWTTKEDRRFFSERTKEAGVIVLGYTTYKTIGKPLPDRLNIVYSTTADIEGVEVTQKDPAQLLKDLEARGFKEVAICGGSQVYTMFMKAGLVDKLYLTIEPVLFGDGIKLFRDSLNVNLELVAMRKLGDSTMLLEYNIKKSDKENQ